MIYVVDFNVPIYQSDKVTLGQCIVYMNLYTDPQPEGSTPSTDIGAIDELTLTVNRELLNFEQGTPRMICDQFASRDAAQLTFKGWEWNYNTQYNALGAGITLADVNETLRYGGKIQTDKVQIMLEHQAPDGATTPLSGEGPVCSGISGSRG